MAVTALSEFPDSFIAGDTLRVTLSDSNYPSDEWTLKVLLRGSDGVHSYAAEAGDNNAFDLVISAADSAKLGAGTYAVTFVYTETSSSERVSVTGDAVDVLADPTAAIPKTIARKTLEAMEAALEKLAGGSNSTVSFNGQSFTKKNLKELQDAIDRQRAIVAAEEADLGLTIGSGRSSGIAVRFSRDPVCSW